MTALQPRTDYPEFLGDDSYYPELPANETAAYWLTANHVDLDRCTIDDLVSHVRALQQDADMARHAATGNMDEAPW